MDDVFDQSIYSRGLDAGQGPIQVIHDCAVALGAQCSHGTAASTGRPGQLGSVRFARRSQIADIDLHALLHSLSKMDRQQALEAVRCELFAKAGYKSEEARDAHGRWTASGSEGAPPSSRQLLGHIAPNRFSPAVYRPGGNGAVFAPTAAGEEDEREIEEEILDPTAELRTTLFDLKVRELNDVDPINPALEMVLPDQWVPSWRDVQSMDETLEAAKAARDMELNGEPPPDIWELGWGARGVAAERMRGASLPQNYPGIDRFPSGIAISIKSIDLNAPSYQPQWRLEGRINYYVNRLAAFDGAEWGDVEIQSDQIRGRTLDLIVPRGSVSPENEETIARCRARARRLGIGIITVEY